MWRHRAAYLLILPNFLFFLVFFLLPVAASVYISFVEYLPFSVRWVGWQNYERVISDPVFLRSLQNNAVYTVGVVTFWLGKSLLIAWLLNPLSPRLQAFFKSAFYLPGVTSGVIISLIWLWIYNPAFGLLNSLLRLAGLEPVAWLGERAWALPALIFMQVVMGGGSSIVLLATALGRIPPELYEAALLEGAGRWRIFTSISVPLIKPVLLYLVVMGTINTFQVFESVYVMTQGGPQFATSTIVYRIFETGFVNFRLGEAAAQSMILFAILFVVAYVQFRWLSSEVEY